jgi:8-oxo-dGTP pyrophosphatase MutT (NUDIX family)
LRARSAARPTTPPARVITLATVRRALRGHPPQTIAAPGSQPAAVGLILVPDARGLAALFIHRAERAGDPWSGQVALPGGRREPADQDLLATALRETREETGVDLRAAELLGALDDLHPRTPSLPPVLVRPFVFALPERPTLVPTAEVERAFWLPLADLAKPGVYSEVTVTVRGTAFQVPGYQIGDELIWGLTERIVTPFLQLAGVL